MDGTGFLGILLGTRAAEVPLNVGDTHREEDEEEVHSSLSVLGQTPLIAYPVEKCVVGSRRELQSGVVRWLRPSRGSIRSLVVV
jgi:hypothetical protein